MKILVVGGGGREHAIIKKIKENPDVTLPAEERPIGGLGIFMTKKTMDEVSYEYKDGQNILRIKKKME